MKKLRTRSLEVNLTAHCNLRCAGCDHLSPLAAVTFADLGQVERDLGALAPVLCTRELKLLGGEPLLHAGLLDFARLARATGLARRVVLVTNGVLLHRMDERVLDAIDVLRVSVYPGVRIRADLAALKRRLRSRGRRLEVQEVRSFRRTVLDRRSDDDRAVRRIYESCKIAHRWSCHAVHRGRFYKCSPAPFLEERFGRDGASQSKSWSDGLDLHRTPDLRVALERYLQRGTPLEACRHCLGTSGAELPHRQLSRAELAGVDFEHARGVSAMAVAR